MRLLKLVPDNTNLDFMRWRNVALVLSIVATIASLVLIGVRGLNLGIDFVGGQQVRVTFAKPVGIEELRARVGAHLAEEVRRRQLTVAVLVFAIVAVCAYFVLRWLLR